MREEVISSGTVEPLLLGRSSSPPQTPAASSVGASSPAVPANAGSIDWFGSAQGSKVASASHIGSMPPQTSVTKDAGSSAVGLSQPSCRPWERGDLLRRLATFKPSNWTGKPKEVSSLACARRGWVNIDGERIECESCGAQLNFATAASWTVSEADGAGAVLDMGHKVACPWRGNCCADSLVQFPPTPSSALIDGFKDRCDGLLQFLSLPVIASSAIEKMRLSRSPQIDRFLSQSYGSTTGEIGVRADNMPITEFLNEDTLSTYYHAQKLISLCGWEPRWLPNVLDCEEHSAQSARNACSAEPSGDKFHVSKDCGFNKNAFSASAKKATGKKKISVPESSCNSRSPLLDCSLCGATVKIWDFLTVPRTVRFGPNNNDPPETNKKMASTRGVSAASGISGWVLPDEMEKEQTDARYEAATDEGKSPSNAGVDLNLTMAGGLPSSQVNMPATSEHFDNVLGRDLMIGQPSGSEVGDRAASYESRGPSPRKRSLEEGGSTVDRPQDRLRQADSIEGTVIDRDGDEVDDGRQYSDGPSKRARSLDMFNTHHSGHRVDSSGAGPSRTLGIDLDIDVNRVENYREGSDFGIGYHSTRDSARASSVVAMDTVCHGGDDDSMESVDNIPGDVDDVHFQSPSIYQNLDMNDAPEFDYSNHAQQSTCLQPAAGSIARDVGTSSTNGEEILNAETVTAQARDRFSFGISGGSVGMGASHEAEIHGNDASVHRTDSVVGEAEPIAEVTENQGQMGESAPGPGLMDEFVPEEMRREDPHGDSQDVMSQSTVRADSGSKIYGSTKAESVESGEKISRALGLDGSAHPSLSCNAGIYSSYDVSKEEVTQAGKASTTDGCIMVESDCAAANGMGLANGENVCEVNAGEFNPITHHNHFCPWVNGNVAAAGGSSSSGSTSSTLTVALCGWELTLDALDVYQSLGHISNQTMKSESAASLYKDEHITHGQKLRVRSSTSKNHGQL